MAEATEKSASQKPGKTTLDQLSREDLLKQVKRQLALLQKTKAKYDELSKTHEDVQKENEKLKQKNDFFENHSKDLLEKITDLETEKQEIQTELDDHRTKRKSLEAKLNKLKENNNDLNRNYQSSEEQIECLKMKLDTLTMTCQCMQDELKKSQQENRDLSDQSKVLIEARDQAVMSLHLLKDSSQESCDNFKEEKEHFQRKEKEYEYELLLVQTDKEKLAQQLEQILSDNKVLEESNIKIQTTYETLLKECESLKLKFKTAESEIVNTKEINEEFPLLKSQKDELELLLNESSKESKILSEMLSNETEKVKNLTSHIEILEREKDSAKTEISNLSKTIEDLQFLKDHLQHVHTFSINNNILYEKISKSVNRINNELNILENTKQDQDFTDNVNILNNFQQFLRNESKDLKNDIEEMKLSIQNLNDNLDRSAANNCEIQIQPLKTEENREISCKELKKISDQCSQVTNICKETGVLNSEEDIRLLQEKCCCLESQRNDILSELLELQQKFALVEKSYVKTTENKLNYSVVKHCDINELSLDSNYYQNAIDFSINSDPEEMHSSYDFFSSSSSKAEQKDNVGIQCNLTTLNLKSELTEALNKAENFEQKLEEKSLLVEQMHLQIDTTLAEAERLTSELEIKENDLKSAGNIIENLSHKVQKLECQEKEKQEDLLSLKEELRYLNEEKVALISELEALKEASDKIEKYINTIKRYELMLNEKDEQIESLNEEKSGINSEISALKNSLLQIGDLEQQLVDKTALCVDLESHRNSLIKELDCVKESMSGQIGDISELKNNLKDRENKLQQLSAECFKHTSELKMLKAELIPQLEEKIRSLNLELEEKQNIQEGIDKQQQIMKETNEKIQILEVERNLLIDEIESLKSSLSNTDDEKSSELNSLRDQLRELTSIHAEVIKYSNSLEEQVEALKTNASETHLLRSEIAEKEKSLQIYELECVKHTKELCSLKSEVIPELEKRIESLMLDLSSKSSLIADVENQKELVQEKNFKIEQLQDEMSVLNSEISSLKTSLANSSDQTYSELENIKLKLEEKNIICANLEEDKNSLERQLKSLNESTLLMANEMTLMKEQFAEKENYLHTLESECSKHTKELHNLKVQLMPKLEEKISALMQDLENRSFSENEMAKQLKEKDQIIESAQLENSQLNNSFTNTTEEFLANIDSLKLQLEERCAVCSNLEKDKDNLNHQVKLLNENILENKNEIEQLKTKINERQKYSSSIELKSSECDKELQSLKAEKIPELENKIIVLLQDLDTLTTKFSSLEAENKELLEKKDHKQCEEEQNSLTKLENSLKESETKSAKLKAVALKTKRELNETKKQLADTREEMEKITANANQYLKNFQTLQIEYDKLEDKYEEEKTAGKKREGSFISVSSELSTVREQLVLKQDENNSIKNLLESSIADKKVIEKSKLDLEGKIIVLESEQSNEKQKQVALRSEINALEKKVEDVEEQLKMTKDKHKTATQKLEEALKESKKKSVLDLEMEDYEKTVSEMSAQLQQKNIEISELQEEISTQNAKIKDLQEEIKHCELRQKSEEDRSNNLKNSLTKLKKELAETREQNIDLLNQEKLLKSQLESVIQDGEGYKVQLADITAKYQQLMESLKTTKEYHQRALKSNESKILILEEDLDMARKEIDINKQEFESYKVRVHSVLKQQKTTTAGASFSVEQEIREKLEKTVEQLQLKLEELSNKLIAVNCDSDALQEDHDRLLQLHTKLMEEVQVKEESWNQRFQQLNREKENLKTEKDESNRIFQQQNEMLASTYRHQLEDVQVEHKKTVDNLEKQLEAADIEIARILREQPRQQIPPSPSNQDDAFTFDISSQERQEGEGSEFTEIATPVKHLSLATLPTTGFTPLEQLLQSSQPPTPSSMSIQQDSEAMSYSLTSSYKKIDHLAELLNESEATNVRLEEQVRVLKEEIRRIERNTERQQHAENLEYLKNVVMKFITLEGNTEKERLIPVLTTMLRLSPEEQNKLQLASGGSFSYLLLFKLKFYYYMCYVNPNF